MGLAKATWSTRLALVALVIASLFALRFDPRWLLVAVLGLAVVQLGVEALLRRWAWKRACAAIDRHELPQAYVLLSELKELSAGSPGAIDVVDLQLAAVESLSGRYAQARVVLERLLESEHLARHRAAIESHLAWALMHLGLTGRALELAKKALSERPHEGQFKATYAVGLVLAGRAADALPLLEQVLAEHAADGPNAQAARAFYLGEALEVLGRKDEAKAAWERAGRETPQSSWAEQARGKLR